MDGQRESACDRREWLVTVARGAAATGTLAAAATLLARGGPVRQAPCGTAADCTGCLRLTGCQLRPADVSSLERKKA